MARKTYQVWFAKIVVGNAAAPFQPHMERLVEQHGNHLPAIDIEGDRMQMRGLERVGTVWKGVFARLRTDAPHVIDGTNQERELEIEEGASIIEKSMFLFREQDNLLIWQNIVTVGGIKKASAYLSQLIGEVVLIPSVQNSERLEEMMNHNLYEIDFHYAKPPAPPAGVDAWSQRWFDIMGSAGAAHGHFVMRANRNGTLRQEAKNALLRAAGLGEFKRLKIRLEPGDDPIKLFLAPIRDEFTIEVFGRYANPVLVYQGLEEAYDRQRALIAANAA